MTRPVFGRASRCHTAPMRLIWLARGLGVSGLAAVSALAAHEGPAAFAGGRPLIIALAGAAAAAIGVGLLLAAAVSRYARAARVRRGDLLAARLDTGTAPGASALAAILLVCQGAAHVSLTLFGVAAHGGPPAALALHVLFGLGAAAADDRLRAPPPCGRRNALRCDRHSRRNARVQAFDTRFPTRPAPAGGTCRPRPPRSRSACSRRSRISEPPARAGRSSAAGDVNMRRRAPRRAPNLT